MAKTLEMEKGGKGENVIKESENREKAKVVWTLEEREGFQRGGWDDVV